MDRRHGNGTNGVRSFLCDGGQSDSNFKNTQTIANFRGRINALLKYFSVITHLNTEQHSDDVSWIFDHQSVINIDAYD